MDREHWLEWTDLTRKDLEELVNSVRWDLIQMESKNLWDTTVNEMGFDLLLYRSLDAMIEKLDRLLSPEREEDIEFYAYYPKIEQLLDYEDDIAHVKISGVEAMKMYGVSRIYEAIERWWKNRAGWLE